MGRHATRRPTRRTARPLVLVLAAGVVTAAAGTLALVPAPGTTPAAQERTGDPPTVVLAIGGAVSFGGRTLPLLEDPAGPFGGTSEILRSADVSLVDLVAPADGAAPPPAALAALADAGVDGVGLLDPRWSGPTAADTTAALSAAGLGHGDTWVARTGPVPVAVFATPADATDTTGLLTGVATADRAGDVVVVRIAAAPGGGCADAASGLTAALVAAGADVVVGGVPAGGPASGSDDRRAWVLPTPGPLLLAADSGPVDSGIVVLRVSADGVQDAETVPLLIDAFGRAQPTAAASSGTPPCTPAASR